MIIWNPHNYCLILAQYLVFKVILAKQGKQMTSPSSWHRWQELHRPMPKWDILLQTSVLPFILGGGGETQFKSFNLLQNGDLNYNPWGEWKKVFWKCWKTQACQGKLENSWESHNWIFCFFCFSMSSYNGKREAPAGLEKQYEEQH